ncbi:MAG: rhodanese-like domain-containing protein [Desulforhopalus sp.]
MKYALISVLLLLLTSSFSNALDRFDIVTTEELHSLLQERENGKIDFLLLNTLDTLIFNHHSIPGSINIPWNTIEGSSQLLAWDKNIPIITYCMGYR